MGASLCCKHNAEPVAINIGEMKAITCDNSKKIFYTACDNPNQLILDKSSLKIDKHKKESVIIQKIQHIKKQKQAKMRKVKQEEQGIKHILIEQILIDETKKLNWYISDKPKEFMKLCLTCGMPEYQTAKTLFLNTGGTKLKHSLITAIKRVQNQYNYGRYLLRKEEMIQLFGTVEEKLLFHGTRSANIDNICRGNFDWRLGDGGVAFTPRSEIAYQYCDDGNDKVMIVASVLISRTVDWSEDLVLPLSAVDTCLDKSDADNPVYLKYTDDDFYPAYIIRFSDPMYRSNEIRCVL